MRIVHYLNQFFGGLGGEEKAGTGLESRDGAVGPGKVLSGLLRSIDRALQGCNVEDAKSLEALPL